jgi:hypothetical protein
MKEIPMLFSTPMVQALLAGRKTQTRRIADVPVGDHFGTDIMDWGLSEHPHLSEGKWTYTIQPDVDDSRTFYLKDKYGVAGDLIWVRETWAPYLRGTDGNGFTELIKYKADGAELPFKHVKDYAELGWHNRPGIHMNKEYARIWLRVANVRVERLQDITEEDAKAEGIKSAGCEDHLACPSKLCISECVDRASWWNYMAPDGEDFPCFTAKESFESLWNSINGRESWNDNPWVWVVSLNVLSTTGKTSTLTEKMEG